MYKKVLILLFFIPFQLLFAQTSMLKDFPEGSTPEEIGKRLAYRFPVSYTHLTLPTTERV